MTWSPSARACELGPLYDALATHGRTVAAGCGPTVGISGLTLGGGIGILGRRHGLTCDQLVSAQVVLADGRIVECDAEREPDLFWALRGAGGARFGVVTRLTLKTVPAERTTVFDVVLPRTRAHDVIADWQRWAPHAPEELAASLLVTTSAVHVFGAYLGGRDEAARELARFDGPRGSRSSNCARPSSGLRTTARARNCRTRARHSSPRHCRSIRRSTASSTSCRSAAPSTASRPTPPPIAHRDALFCLHLEAEDQETRRPGFAAVEPYSTGGVYPNFAEPQRDLWDPAYHLGNRERLLADQSRLRPRRHLQLARTRIFTWRSLCSTSSSKPPATTSVSAIRSVTMPSVLIRPSWIIAIVSAKSSGV